MSFGSRVEALRQQNPLAAGAIDEVVSPERADRFTTLSVVSGVPGYDVIGARDSLDAGLVKPLGVCAVYLSNNSTEYATVTHSDGQDAVFSGNYTQYFSNLLQSGMAIRANGKAHELVFPGIARRLIGGDALACFIDSSDSVGLRLGSVHLRKDYTEAVSKHLEQLVDQLEEYDAHRLTMIDRHEMSDEAIINMFLHECAASLLPMPYEILMGQESDAEHAVGEAAARRSTMPRRSGRSSRASGPSRLARRRRGGHSR